MWGQEKIQIEPSHQECARTLGAAAPDLALFMLILLLYPADHL
jgi:hypothetical protein